VLGLDQHTAEDMLINISVFGRQIDNEALLGLVSTDIIFLFLLFFLPADGNKHATLYIISDKIN